MKYFDELQRSMTWLGEQTDTVFIGQAVEYAGTAMTNTLKYVSSDKLIEMPVNEDMQMGITNGLAIRGYVPISIYPRWNFLILGLNQLINHLDKFNMISDYKTKAIIRTGIGSERPLHPQYQHIGDYTDALKLMVSNIEVIRVDEPDQIFESYKHAYNRTDGKSTLIIEWGDYYNEK
jgi:pyruvate/2-oxoglutarate/acetoin dehydrogenase E1 component